MTTVQIFDPAMCCSSGVCGPGVDPELVRFAADVEWLAQTGVAVERFNLAQQPEAFVAHGVVTEALREGGEAVLPLIVVDGRKVSEGVYPTRENLMRWVSARTAGTGSPSLVVLAPADDAGGCSCGEGGCC